MRFIWLLACLATFFVPAAQADTYLVLPFFNVSKNSSLDWIGEGLAETVQEALSSEGLMVLDRDDRVEVYRRLSVRPYTLLTKASVVKIGEELDAEHVIFGQFDMQPAPEPTAGSRGSLLITASVLHIKGMRQGMEFRESGAIEDLAALQNHLAWQTLRTIHPNLATTEAEFQQNHPSIRLDAIENYIRGLMAVNPDDKHRFFTQAARLDAHYSQPCFQLGRLLWKRKEYKTAADWFQRVSPSDSRYRQANFFLGLCRYYTGDFAGAQAAFQLVASTVPLNEVYNDLERPSRASIVPKRWKISAAPWKATPAIPPTSSTSVMRFGKAAIFARPPRIFTRSSITILPTSRPAFCSPDAKIGADPSPAILAPKVWSVSKAITRKAHTGN